MRRSIIITGISLILLILYQCTAPEGITWQHGGQDGAELVVTASRFGIAHPPGYALYNALGWLSMRLPIGTLADRLLVTSHLYAIGAALLLSAIAARLLPDYGRGMALPAAVMLALGWTLWSQAIIVEVYALLMLLFCAAWLVCLPVSDRSAHPARPFWAGLILGLAITHHLSALLWIPGLIVIYGRWTRADCARLVGGAVIGLIPIGVLMLRAGVHPEANWGGLETGLHALIDHLTGRIYQGYLVAAAPNGFAEAIRDWVIGVPKEISIVGVRLVLVGLIAMVWRREFRLLMGMALWTLLLITLTALYRAEDTREVYRLPLSAVLVLCVVYGIAALMTWRRWAGWLFATGIIVALVMTNLPAVTLRGERAAYAYLDELHSIAPAGSIIVTGSTRPTFTIWYAVYADSIGHSGTWIPIDRTLWRFDWYRRNLDRLYPYLAPFDGTLERWLRSPRVGSRIIVSDQSLLPPDGRTVVRQGEWSVMEDRE